MHRKEYYRRVEFGHEWRNKKNARMVVVAYSNERSERRKEREGGRKRREE